MKMQQQGRGGMLDLQAAVDLATSRGASVSKVNEFLAGIASCLRNASPSEVDALTAELLQDRDKPDSK